MRNLILFIFSIVFSLNLYAQENAENICRSYRTDVIRIGNHASNSFGQGIIVAEANDSLYIVTAEHVLKLSDESDSLNNYVIFYDHYITKAVIKYQGNAENREQDIAVLAVKKPPGYQWMKINMRKEMLDGHTKLFYIDNKQFENIHIPIIAPAFGEGQYTPTFTINMDCAKEGDSGSAVWVYDNNIQLAGMLIQTNLNNDSLCTAISINTITNLLTQKCQLKIFTE